MFKYEYTSPTPEQLGLRRQQLDQAGFQAWLSPAILLLTIYAARTLHKSFSNADARGGKSNLPPSWPVVLWRRSQWVLTQPINPSVGSPYIILATSFYFVYLVYLATRNTTNDYMHLTKSIGHVAVSQLPWHYLLALKSASSPVTMATGLTHERLNAWHRSFGRIIAVLVLGHATLYLKFFSDVGVLRKRLGDWDVRLGLMALTTVSGLMIGSLPVVRRKAYWKGFYIGHVMLSANLLIVVWLHMGWTRRYVLQASIWWVINAWLRMSGAATVQLEVDKVDEGSKQSRLVKMRLRRSTGGGELVEGWVPGQHVYLRVDNSAIRSIPGRKNPFTIADLSSDRRILTLVVRKLDGTTTMLSDFHGQTLLLEGPYGEATNYVPPLLKAGASAGQILLVAGGVGATYTLPVYLALLDARKNTAGLKMVWVVRTIRDIAWAIELLKNRGKRVDIEVYVKHQSNDSTALDSAAVPGLTITYTDGKRPNIAEILAPIMLPKDDDSANKRLSPNATKKDPRTKALKKRYEKLTVMLCGPPLLSQDVRRQVGKHVLGYGREVKWFEEQFGFGGS